MAHPDIMIDDAAIAEADDVPEQAFGRHMVEVVITRRHPEAMLGHQSLADRQHRSRAVATAGADLGPTFRRTAEGSVKPRVAGRHEAVEHPVDTTPQERR